MVPFSLSVVIFLEEELEFDMFCVLLVSLVSPVFVVFTESLTCVIVESFIG